MGAHSLTIARQLLAIRDDEQLIRQAESALNAPGMNPGAADPGNDAYSAIYDAVKDTDLPTDARTSAIRNACRAIARSNAFLDGYACLEDALQAYRAYVRVGVSYWRTRSHKWHAGAPEAHRTAKPGSAPQYPEAEEVPACAADMGCLCAGHARGAPASAACDTSETVTVHDWRGNLEAAYPAEKLEAATGYARELAAVRDGAGRIVATAACPVASGPDGLRLRLLWCEEHNVHYVAGGGRWVAHSSDHCRGGEQLASCETFYRGKISASCAGRGKRCAFHDYTLTVVDGRATFVRRDAAASATGGDSQVQPAQPTRSTPEAIVSLDSPGNYYWTVVIPYAGERATQWHPTEATGPFSILTRGVFSSAQLAHDWARAKLGGHPYSLRPYAVGPVSCVVQFIDCAGTLTQHATPCAAVGILATTDGPKEYALCADHAHTITEGRCHAGDWEFSTFAPVASGGDS